MIVDLNDQELQYIIDALLTEYGKQLENRDIDACTDIAMLRTRMKEMQTMEGVNQAETDA